MRSRHLLSAIAVAALCAVSHGQEVTPPATGLPDSSPVGPGSAPPPAATPPFRTPSGGVVPGTTPAPSEIPLIPDAAPASSFDKPEAGTGVPPIPQVPRDRVPEKPKDKRSKTEIFEQDLQDRIKFREVKTRALADPTIVALWDRSVVARTDAEKRANLKQYYKLLYARMTKLDPSIKKLIDLQASNAEHRLTQTRITPTEASETENRSTSARLFAE